MMVEEIAGGVVDREPVAMQKKIVNFVGEDELFDFHVFGAKAGNQIYGLSEKNVAIIITMDEQDWRTPSVYGGDG